jgi:SAM-dependent methyltransferase
LSLAGYDITGIDFSTDMLREARSKARKYGADVRFLNDDIVKVRLDRRFDLLICLGNTLPLITGIGDSRRLLKNCIRHLKPGGAAIFQMLNYDRILKEKPTTFAVDSLDDLIRIKQYRYGAKLLDFVITLIENSKVPPVITISKRKLRPWTRREISVELKDAGFKKVSAYKDYSRERFNLSSKDLVIVAET